MNSAQVIEKIILTGTMKLLSPLAIGAGTDAVGIRQEVDAQVLKDKNEQAFIPGTSIAGVLRHWLTENQINLKNQPKLDTLLFGSIKEDTQSTIKVSESIEEDTQSAIKVSDVVLTNASHLVVRDGVRVDGITGTAVDKAKYDFEAVDRGGYGPFRMEITLRQAHQTKVSLGELEDVTRRLANRLYSGIRLGGGTSKGFGRVACEDVRVDFYNFAHEDQAKAKAALKAWLLKEPSEDFYMGQAALEENTASMIVDIDCAIKSSLIVRTTNDEAESVQLTSRNGQDEDGDFVIPGSSVKGVLRHQAQYIVNQLGGSLDMLDDLMGSSRDGDTGSKSRFITDEVYFSDDLVEGDQTRVHIDRFTNAVFNGALFKTHPVWQINGDEKTVHLHFEIEPPRRDKQAIPGWEVGLALLLIKDICTGRVAFGGEKSIGRGVMRGLAVNLVIEGELYQMDSQGQLVQGDGDLLELYVGKFVDACKVVE